MLYDECKRCDEQVERLTSLDSQKLVWFWHAMHGIKIEGKALTGLTDNEWEVINKMYEMAVVLERIVGTWPSPRTLMSMGAGE